MVDTSDEWIVQRTGIRERRVCADDEFCSDISAKAAEQALEHAGMTAEELDLVVCCTVTGDQPFPSTACEIAHQIGATNAGGWDLGAACSGFVFGAQTGAAFVGSGQMKNVMVIGAERLSTIMDYNDRTTCVLFGDGAGAAIFTSLERADGNEFLGGSIGLTADREAIIQPGGGSRVRASHESIEGRQHFLKMDGKKTYKFAVKAFADVVARALAPYGYDQLGLVIPHQVNKRIIEAAADRLGLPMEKFFVNIDKYGNTSAASVPMAMQEAEAEGRFEKGKIYCMCAFGSGLAWGHFLLRH
ncbi:MAG: 3-oxoacyl-ACP synthase III family protein [Planctomycetota bacterium]